MLTVGERVLLLVHCGDHPVAGCSRCGELIRFNELAIDTASGRRDYCPRCQLDLTAPLRRHLVACTWIRVQVRETHTRAWVLLEEATQAAKISEQRRHRADVLGREAEAERNRSRNVKRGQNLQLWEEASATPRDIAGGRGAFALTQAYVLGHATGARGTHDMSTVLIAHRLGHSRNGGHPKVLKLRERRMRPGRCAIVAAAAVAIITVSALGDRPTLDVGRYGVSREHAASREITSQTLRIGRPPVDETPRPLTTKTPRSRVATSTSPRPIRALQAPIPHALVPAVGSTTSTSPTAQVVHQAP
jgi:hypothetical protein